MPKDELELMPAGNTSGAVATPETKPPTSLDILDAAVRGGITSENVAVVKEIIAMRREEVAAENKAEFNRAFFELKTEIARMNFYADKAAKDDNGRVAYRYCSETELSAGLDPVLLKHGFTMNFGQRADEARSVAIITLIHRKGHEETREFSVRSGKTNRMKGDTEADTGATTSAWRHLVMKMFSLKSRITEDDVRLEGDPNEKVTQIQADELERRAQELNRVPAFLNFAFAFQPKTAERKFADIPANRYDELDAFLRRLENPKAA